MQIANHELRAVTKECCKCHHLHFDLINFVLACLPVNFGNVQCMFPYLLQNGFSFAMKKIYLKLYPGATGDSESSSLNNTTQPRNGLKNHGASLATYWTAANVKIILWFKRPHRMGPLKLSDQVIQTIQTGGK